MQENNFEKQVQQKMEELKFNPSDEVWQKLSVNITKGKRDRRIIAIIFFLLILIGSTIFITRDQTINRKNNQFISGSNFDTNTKSVNEVNRINDLRQIETSPNSPQKNKEESVADEMENPKNITVKNKNVDLAVAEPIPLAAPATTSSSLIADKIPVSKQVTYPADSKGTVPVYKNKDNKKAKGKATALIGSGLAAEKVSDKKISNNLDNTKDEELIPGTQRVVINDRVTDTVSKANLGRNKKTIEAATVLPAIQNNKDIGKTVSIYVTHTSKWTIGFNISLGITAMQNSFLGIAGLGDGSKALFDAGQITSSNPGQSTNTTHTPSEIKSGPGLLLGIFVHKYISPKMGLLLGLNYKVYSSSINVGNKVDSSFAYSSNSSGLGNFYYSTGNSTSYKNNFHFIELPVALQFKLSKPNKRGVYLNTGVSIAHLIGTNALQFDTPTGDYYSNDDLLNKTQFSLSTGLLFALSRQAKNPFLLGPDINFSLSKMANTGLYKDRHYSYFGILLQKGISKK